LTQIYFFIGVIFNKDKILIKLENFIMICKNLIINLKLSLDIYNSKLDKNNGKMLKHSLIILFLVIKVIYNKFNYFAIQLYNILITL
jgi:hypothetical protein